MRVLKGQVTEIALELTGLQFFFFSFTHIKKRTSILLYDCTYFLENGIYS